MIVVNIVSGRFDNDKGDIFDSNINKALFKFELGANKVIF